MTRAGRTASTVRLALAVLLALAAFVSPAAAERPAEARESARTYFTDVELVNQDGETMRLYSDLMDGKIVVIDSIFTTCTAVCPVLGQKMQAIQEAAGDRMGEDVHLISISVDPQTDTPAKLKAYGERFGARQGWYFLTGSQENVELALSKLGYAVEDKESHSTVVLMGNEKTGLWKKTNGLSASASLVELFETVAGDTGAGAAGAGRGAGGAGAGSR